MKWSIIKKKMVNFGQTERFQSENRKPSRRYCWWRILFFVSETIIYLVSFVTKILTKAICWGSRRNIPINSGGVVSSDLTVGNNTNQKARRYPLFVALLIFFFWTAHKISQLRWPKRKYIFIGRDSNDVRLHARVRLWRENNGRI